jgi:tetratricopeptide (TPR) repeat protein
MEKLTKIAQSILLSDAHSNGDEIDISEVRVFKVVEQDVDGDGQPEICFAAGIPDVWDTAICCLLDFHNDRYRVVELVPISNGFRDLQIFDINQDGILEIVTWWQAGSGAYLSLYIFQWDGNVLKALFPETEPFHQGFVEMKDLDADGVNEIVIWKGRWAEELQETTELSLSDDMDMVNLENIDFGELVQGIQEVEQSQWSSHHFDIYVFRYQENTYQLQTIHTSERRYNPSDIVSRKISIMGTPPDVEHRFTSVEAYREQLELLIKNRQVNEDFVATLTEHQSVLWQEGFYEEAISVANLALEATKHLSNSSTKMRLLVLLWREKGVTLSFLGDYPQAVDCHLQAISAWTDDVSPYFPAYYRAGLQRELGTMYAAVGDYERALSSFFTARTILEAVDLSVSENREELSRLHSNFGLTYARLGEPNLSIASFEQAIALDKELGITPGLAINYMSLGNIQRTLKKYPEAIESYQAALKVLEEVSERDRESDVYLELGSTLILTRQLEEGLQYLHKALLLTSVGNLKQREAIHYLYLGEAYKELDQLQLAARFFNKAIALAKEFETPETQWQAFYGLALTYQRQSEQPACQQALEAAIDTIEKLRSQYLPETFKISLFAQKTKPYEAMVLACSPTHPEQAFDYVERAKSRIFIEQLATTAIGNTTDIPPELAEREAQLIGELRRSQLRHREALSQQQYEWGDEIAQIEGQLEQLWHEIGSTGNKASEYVALRKAMPLKFSGLQKTLNSV